MLLPFAGLHLLLLTIFTCFADGNVVPKLTAGIDAMPAATSLTGGGDAIDNSTNLHTANINILLYPTVVYYTEKHHRGTFTGSVIDDLDLLDSWQGAICQNLDAKTYFHHVGTFSLTKLYWRNDPNQETHPGDKRRYHICRIFENYECDGGEGWRELQANDHGQDDLSQIGWQDRVGSYHCKWK